MYTVRLTRVPENGSAEEEGVRLSLADLALGPPFTGGEVEVSWELSRLMGKVYGKLSASGDLSLSCGRCLKDFPSSVKTEFAVLFEPKERGAREARAQAALDLDADDAGPSVVFFDGESLPLGEELRQELELAVPYRSLCRMDCAGLCARCGRDLNEGPCGCRTDADASA